MKIKPLLIALMLFPLAIIAQKPFSITGDVKGIKDGRLVFLVYRDITGKIEIVDSSEVKEGRFTFKGTIDVPAVAFLNVGNKIYAHRAGPLGSRSQKRFYVEPAELQISSSGVLGSAKVVGGFYNKENDKLEAWIAEERKKSYDEGQKFSTNGAKLAFAKANPQSPINLFVLRDLIKDLDYFEASVAVFNQLDTQIKTSPLGNLIAKEIKRESETDNNKLGVSSRLSIGELAPDFAQQDPNGKTVKLSDFRGKYVLLDFWASWCGPCREENPNILAAYNQNKDKGFTVLGVSADSDAATWLKAIATDKLKWPQVSDLRGNANAVLKMYNIKAIPSSFLIDPNGKIVAKDLRGKDLNDKLAELFSK